MLSKQALFLRIREIYPDFGACGIDIKVDCDDPQDRWAVQLNKNEKQLKFGKDGRRGSSTIKSARLPGHGQPRGGFNHDTAL
jgi:hypothetical protein